MSHTSVLGAVNTVSILDGNFVVMEIKNAKKHFITKCCKIPQLTACEG